VAFSGPDAAADVFVLFINRYVCAAVCEMSCRNKSGQSASGNDNRTTHRVPLGGCYKETARRTDTSRQTALDNSVGYSTVEASKPIDDWFKGGRIKRQAKM